MPTGSKIALIAKGCGGQATNGFRRKERTAVADSRSSAARRITPVLRNLHTINAIVRLEEGCQYCGQFLKNASTEILDACFQGPGSKRRRGSADGLFPHPSETLAPLEKAARDEVDRFLSVNFAVLRLTMAGSFLDMPGVTIPTGFSSEGLPTGMLLAGLSGEDNRVLTMAASVEKSSVREL